MLKTEHEARPVRLSKEALAYLPSTLREWAENGNQVYAMTDPENGKIMVSGQRHPIGAICTIVEADHVEYLDGPDGNDLPWE